KPIENHAESFKFWFSYSLLLTNSLRSADNAGGIQSSAEHRGDRTRAAQPAIDCIEEQLTKVFRVFVIIAVADLATGIDVPIAPLTNPFTGDRQAMRKRKSAYSLVDRIVELDAFTQQSQRDNWK